MGGAFTAISDDPSGAYYNPAGLSFAYEDSISMTTFSQNYYKKNENEFQTFSPNFIGSIKSFGKYKFGLSIVNRYNQSYRYSEIIDQRALSLLGLKDVIFQDTKEANQLLFGPSLSKSLTPNLSIGASLYILNDYEYTTTSYLIRDSENQIIVESSKDDRTNRGIFPVLGLLYAIQPKLSVGLSINRVISNGRGNRSQNSFLLGTNSTGENTIGILQGTHDESGGKINDIISYTGPKFSANIPQITEIRLGLAWFPSAKFLAAFDAIYTDGYKTKVDQTRYFFSGLSMPYILFSNNVDEELYRTDTLNLAFGLEYFFKENFSLRAGIFTNQANTPRIEWIDSILQSITNDVFDEEEYLNLDLNTTQTTLYYVPNIGNLFGKKRRSEHINNIGYSLGISWNLSRASFNLSLVYEYGKGNSINQFLRIMESAKYESLSIYFAVSSKK